MDYCVGAVARAVADRVVRNFPERGKVQYLAAVPADAVFKVNIRSVNSVHERLKRNFIWRSLKITLFRGVSLGFAIYRFTGK